jgi:hypothetical protein
MGEGGVEVSGDAMKFDDHERAGMMIALSRAGGFSGEPSRAESAGEDRAWLAEHLESCMPCREFAEKSRDTVRALRGISIAAGGDLVSATRMRVRRRAVELQRQRERLWVVCVCSAAVTFSAATSTLVLCGGLAWMGQPARLSGLVWATGWAVFSLMPAVVVGILLLARGTYFADRRDLRREDFQGNDSGRLGYAGQE